MDFDFVDSKKKNSCNDKHEIDVVNSEKVDGDDRKQESAEPRKSLSLDECDGKMSVSENKSKKKKKVRLCIISIKERDRS